MPIKMPVTAPMRKAMKSYAKFFENKERVAVNEGKMIGNRGGK